jgi:DNA-binding NarL/FixJ family response regulator
MKSILLLGARVGQAGQLRRVTILLADDHPRFPQLVEGLLNATFEVLGSVGDGKALVDSALKLKPDVIITDISMPILNGIEAAEQLKKEGCKAKIIFLTVHTGADFVRACLDLGAVGYVVKPRVATELVPAIQEVLAGRVYVSPQASLESTA